MKLVSIGGTHCALGIICSGSYGELERMREENEEGSERK